MVTGESGASCIRPKGGTGIADRSSFPGFAEFSWSVDTGASMGTEFDRTCGERAWGEDGADITPCLSRATATGLLSTRMPLALRSRKTTVRSKPFQAAAQASVCGRKGIFALVVRLSTLEMCRQDPLAGYSGIGSCNGRAAVECSLDSGFRISTALYC